MLEKVTV